MFWVLVVLLLFTLPAGAQEISGSVEIGEKFFDLVGEEEDCYTYRRAYIRFGSELSSNSNYSLRYELQKRDYIERLRFSSLMQEFRGSLTWQISDFWRKYYYLTLRGRSYPHAPASSYISLIPEFQVNYYPSDRTTYTGRYRYQFRNYPQELEKNFHQNTLTLSFRHRLQPSLTVNGRFRVLWEIPVGGDELEFEHRFSLGFRYVLD